MGRIFQSCKSWFILKILVQQTRRVNQDWSGFRGLAGLSFNPVHPENPVNPGSKQEKIH
jgi:hypothetical protein